MEDFLERFLENNWKLYKVTTLYLLSCPKITLWQAQFNIFHHCFLVTHKINRVCLSFALWVNLRLRLFLTDQLEAALASKTGYHSTDYIFYSSWLARKESLDVLKVPLWLEFLVSPIKILYNTSKSLTIYMGSTQGAFM